MMPQHLTTTPTTGKPLNITVENIKELDGTGNLKAFASVTINGRLTIHSCRIVQQPNQKAWVSLPQHEWTDHPGQKRYSPILELPEKVLMAIQEAVLHHWREGK